MGSENPTRKLKARLTTKGFTHAHGVDYDETFAPVSKMSSMRIYLSLVGMLDVHTHQLDIKTASLNAKLEESIYVKAVYDHMNF